MAIIFSYITDGVHGSIGDDKNGIPFVSSKDIKNGEINFDTKLVSSDGSRKHFSRIKMPIDSILITNSGTLGEIAMIKSDKKFILQKSVACGIVSDSFLPKYIYYWLIKNKKKLISLGTGSAQKNILLKDLRKFEAEQIDKKSQQKIIDIIEPIETKISLVDKQLDMLKKFLISKYISNFQQKTKLSSLAKLLSCKYEGQSDYFATDAFGELSINTNSKQDISNSVPSRADLTPEKNSIIISKLNGENKIFYFEDKPNFVISTGFFNIRTKCVDHVVGFLLSDEFKKQKMINSTGTTMRGLNNDALLKLDISEPNDESSDITIAISKLIRIKNELQDIKIHLVNLLINQQA